MTGIPVEIRGGATRAGVAAQDCHATRYGKAALPSV
jgi:hypothetical protein